MATIFKGRASQLSTAPGANVLLGVWLFISAFVLPQTFDSTMVTWILGVLIALTAVATFVGAQLRYLDGTLGLLVAIAAAGLSGIGPLTRVHDLCIGIAVIALALAPDAAPHPRLRHRHT